MVAQAAQGARLVEGPLSPERAPYCVATANGGVGWMAGSGVCGACGGAIPRDETTTLPRSRWFCSYGCGKWWRANHWWSGPGGARIAAMRRDGHRCRECRAGPKIGNGLEVDHVEPLAAQGFRPDLAYATGCQHHLEGLRTLCRRCHRAKTNAQAETGARLS